MSAQVSAAKPGIVFTIGRAILRPLLWMKFRTKVSGLEHMPSTGAVLIASNPLSACLLYTSRCV